MMKYRFHVVNIEGELKPNFWINAPFASDVESISCAHAILDTISQLNLHASRVDVCNEEGSVLASVSDQIDDADDRTYLERRVTMPGA